MNINELANKVCGELPENFEISIEFEHGSAYVYYFTPDGERHTIESPDDTLEEQIMIAMRQCVRMKNEY